MSGRRAQPEPDASRASRTLSRRSDDHYVDRRVAHRNSWWHSRSASYALRGAPFPVLIFEPGLGRLIPNYTTLAEDLASRGYVVVGLNPTYSASITVLSGHVIASSALGNIPDNATSGQLQGFVQFRKV